jgi:hypothetical protein
MTLENPVLLKEMRVRMRGGRAYWLMAAYVTTFYAMGILSETTTPWSNPQKYAYGIWVLCCGLFSFAGLALLYLTCRSFNSIARTD